MLQHWDFIHICTHNQQLKEVAIGWQNIKHDPDDWELCHEFMIVRRTLVNDLIDSDPIQYSKRLLYKSFIPATLFILVVVKWKDLHVSLKLFVLCSVCCFCLQKLRAMHLKQVSEGLRTHLSHEVEMSSVFNVLEQHPFGDLVLFLLITFN